MKRGLAVVGGMVLVLVAVAGARAEVGVGLKVGSLGAGADLTVGLFDGLNARVGFNTFSYSYESDEFSDGGAETDEVTADLELQSVPVLLDWHPFKSPFRLSGGVVFNDNQITLSADPGSLIEFNDTEFRVNDVEGGVEFDEICPYVGIGAGNALSASGRWNFVFDLGVMMHGEPQASLSAVSSNPALQPALDAAVDAELRDIQDDISSFKFYPVLAVGVSYRF